MYKQHLDEKFKPGIYISIKSNTGIIIHKNQTCTIGTVIIKQEKYKYFQYREGKKVIQKYLEIQKKY